MGRYTTASRAWVAWLAIAAAGVSILSGPPTTATSSDWLLLGLLAICGATAHLFPVRSALGGATYTVTNVFLITGAAILPPQLLTLLAILALTPERWRRRGRPGLMMGWLFNVSQSALALHVGGAWVHFAGVHSLSNWQDVLVLLIGAALFTATQDILVGVIISLQSRTPLFSSDTFRLPALLS